MQNEETPTEVNPFLEIASSMYQKPAQPIAQPDNPFMELAPSMRALSQPPAIGSLSAVMGINPDQAAEATKLGKPLGIGQDLGLRNMDELRRRSMIASVQRSGMLQNNPRLAQSLLDPVFAAQAHDDLDSLEKTSSLFDKVVSVFDAPNWMFGFKTVAAVTGGVERGLGTVERGELGSKQMFGSATPEQLARLEVLDKKLGAIPPGGIVSMTAEVVAQQLATIRSVGTTALIGAGVGAAVSGPAAPVGAAGGFLAGGAAGLMATTTQTEAGNLYRDMVNQGVDPDTAQYAALTGGLLNGIIELAGAKVAAAPFKALASKFIKEGVNAAIAKPTTRAAMAIAGKEYAKQVGTETAEEVGQELVAIASEEIAKAMDGIDSETSFKDAMTRLVDAGIAGFQGSLVLGGIGPTSNFVVDLRRAEATTKQQEFFDGLDAAKRDGKLPKRNLDAYEGFLARQAKGTTADTVYVEAEAAAQVLAQSGLSAEQLEQSIPGIREHLRNALENGGDVTIPTSVYGARLAGTPLGDALRQHVRLSPEAMSVAQAQEFSRKRDALRQEVQEVLASKQETDAAFVAEAQQVEDAAYEQIRATGAFSDIESRTLASLRQAMVVVDAAEAGMTPLQYERERGVPLQVRGPQAVQEGRVAAAAAVDTTIGDEQANLIQTQIAPATLQVQQAIDAKTIDEKQGKQAKDSLRRMNRAIKSKNAGELAAAVYTAKKRNIPQLAQVVAAADQTLASLGVEVVDPVGREYLEGTTELEVVAFEPYQEGQTNEATHVVRTLQPIVRQNGQIIQRGQVVVREGSPQYLARQKQVQEAKKAEMRARLVGAQQPLEQARREPAPEKGVFDANNPPADVTAEGSRKAIMAVMDYEGKIYYDRSATMHGDLLDSFPELDADLIIDGGFIRDGKYIPNTSDGGFAAIEGGRERLALVKAFANKANQRAGAVDAVAQIDIDYLDAVERGDMETAQRMVDEAAESSMPQSKVRVGWGQFQSNETGVVPAPLGKLSVKYHGGRAGIVEFTGVQERISAYKYDGKSNVHNQGIWLANIAGKLGKTAETMSWADAASYANNYLPDAEIYDLFVNITNPIRIDTFSASAVTIEELQSQGYDGAYITDTGAWVAFDPSQVKLADPVTYDEAGNVVPLSRRFDITSPKVFEQAAVQPGEQATLERLQMQAKRGVRRQARKVELSPVEEAAIATAASEFGESAAEIREAVLNHKKAHPTAQGWAPLEFVRVVVKDRADKGKKGLGLEKLDLQYRQIPYAFHRDETGTALSPGNPEYQTAVTSIARRMVDEVRAVLRRANAGDQNAVRIINQSTWYKAMREALRREFGGLGDLFADLLGATSPNTPVRGNWDFALDVLRRAARGDFDVVITKWEAWVETIERLETDLRAYINDEMRAMEARGERPTQAAIQRKPEYVAKLTALKEARELPDDLLPRQENGKKYGFNGGNVVRAMVGLWRTVREQNTMLGTTAQAPKALNFSGNLIGFRSRATIDVWAARMLQRLAALLRIPSMAETGVAGDMLPDGSTTGQFGFGQDVFAEAAQRIRNDAELNQNPQLAQLNDDDLQALVWFIEKELWTVNNWTSVAGEGGSFELEASLAGISDQEMVTQLRKTIDAGIPGKIRAEANRLPAAQQALINWKLDPAKAGWRQRIADLQSELAAIPANLTKKEQRERRSEITERLDAAFQKSGLEKIEQSLADAIKADTKVAQIEEARKAAQAKLISMERRVDRYTAGLSQQQSLDSQGVDYVPTDADQARLADNVRLRAYRADLGELLVAIKSMSTEGRYGSIERSIDLEVIARQGWSPSELWQVMLEEARDARQESTFLSRVLRANETIDPTRHRPGLEIYFRSPIPRNELDALIEKLNANGLDFFTVIVDARRSTEAQSGAMADAVGIRMQYVPEFMQRYGIEDFSGLSEAEIAGKVEAKEAEWLLLADQVRRVMPEVSFAGVFWHETRVAFADAYESEINAITTGTTTEDGGLPAGTQWAGQSISEGLAAANRFVESRAARAEPDGGGQVPGGVQEGDRVGFAQTGVRTVFEQAAPGAPRGQFDLRSLIITINQGGDSSTLAHELIHLRIAEYIRMARSASPSARVLADLETLFDFMGVEGATFAERLAKYDSMPLEQRRPLEEKVTYNFEVYLYENKAPSVELRGVFDRLARWMRRAYKSIRDDLNAIYRREFGKDLPILTPEVRQVFDRMLATPEQIARAQAVRGMKAMFQTQEQSGMNDAEWAAYQALEQDATDAATAELTKATLKELQWYGNAQSKYLRDIQAKHDRARKEIREEVSAQVQLEPVYRAMEFLKRGTIRTDTGEVTAATGAFKLDLAKVRAIMPAGFDPASLKYGKYGMVQEGGIDPDMAAGMFGYGSGVELINSILGAKPIKEEIDARTDQRMLDENSDLATPEARQAAVDMAIHNEARARFIAVEQRWLEKQRRPANDMLQAARQVAQDIIGEVVIRTLNPRRYEAAEAEAARTATTAYREPQDPSTAGQAAATRAYNEAIAAGQTPDEATVAATEAGVAAVAKAQERRADFNAKYGGREPAEVARRAKRQQLVQNQLAREAMLAKEEIAVAGRDFRKFFRSDEKLAKTRDMAPIMAARAILSYYGYGKRGESPAQYLDQLRTYAPDLYDGIAPIVMKSLSGTADYRDLTVTEFRVLRDTVQALWAQARRDRQITVEGERVALDVVLKEMADRLQAIGVGERVGQRQAPGAVDQANRHLLGLRAMMSRVEAWADALDGMAGPGAFTKYLFRPVKQAVDAYRIERNKYVERFVKLLDGIDLPVGKIAAPELDYTFGNGNGGIGRAELLGALMHTGNEGNYHKLLLGRGWGELDADGNLDDSRWRSFVARMIAEGKLTKADYDFVQSIWDLLEEIKPLAQRAHFDMYGYYFKEVEATEVVTPFGTYRGGYVPAATDKFMVQDARVNASMDELEGDWRNSLPSTGAGFTKGRVDYNEALSLDLRLIATHTDAVLRFSMIQPSVKDALKILRDRDLKALLERFDPAVMENMLLPWLNRAARQQATEPGRWKLADKFWGGVRSRAGVATMFANLRNALQQVTGWFPSLLKVKRRYLQSALTTYLGSPKQTAEAVARLSPFMADRMRNQMFELQGTMNELLLNPSKYEKLQQWSSKHGYFLQQAFQNMVDVTTWQGAYNQALAEGETQAEAVARGDAAVRLTQGSLSPEDLSMFEVGTPFYRTFVQFTGYFNMLANLNLGEYQKTVRDMGWRSGKGRLLYIYVMGMLLPAIVSDAIVRSLGGGWDDEDEDGYMDVFMDWFFGSQVRMGAALLPFGSTAYTAITTAFNDKPYDDRITTSPSIAALESATIGTSKAIIAVTDEDKDVTGRNVRDVLTLITLLTGVPVSALGRPAGYLIDVERGEIEPESGYDMIRGMITGTATPESKR